MAVTVHYIDEKGCLCSNVLTTAKIEERHTADAITAHLLKIATEWGIKEKVVAVVTDNGANVVRAVKDAASAVGKGWRHVSCFAHTLNLIVRGAIDDTADLSPLVQKARNIVSFFRRSVVAADKLRQVQISIDNVCTKKLIPDVTTRRNSLLTVLRSLQDLKESVPSLLVLLGKVDLLLTESEWDVISNVIAVLTPFDEVTIELSSESYPSISKVLPLSKILRRHLVQVDCGGFSNVAEDLRKALMEKMQARFISLVRSHP